VLLVKRYAPSIPTIFGRALGSLEPAHKPLVGPYPPARPLSVQIALRADVEQYVRKGFQRGPQKDVTPTAAACTSTSPDPCEVDPFYLFACLVDWEKRENPSSAWELLAAAQSTHPDTRAHARALLAGSRHLGGGAPSAAPAWPANSKRSDGVEEMKSPYGLPIIENCTTCTCSRPGFFCAFPPPIVRALDQVSHKSTLPAGAILFVEGQTPHGIFVLCSGRVNLSTTSREGKILILKTAEAGEPLGLSAAISGGNYETTAETASPCQLNFVDRESLLELMQTYGEVSMRAAHSLSREFHSAYRDIHDLVLTRSSTGKLARLLLSQSLQREGETELRVPLAMTHEEMAQRIGSSRETVTRLLSHLRKRRLIQFEGSNLVIRDRSALEALAV